MFEFKKAMQGISKQEEFECECCGAMEDETPNGSAGCTSGCAPKDSGNEKNPGKKQNTGCAPCNGNTSAKSQNSGAKTSSDGSCCG